ncbi:hypothetical protein BCD48_45135 [Pseudofrankia sp. BMG5.36]|nr:hypothetical protein BCD48_45135 [Pseudofrankia sp. BMG5.36]
MSWDPPTIGGGSYTYTVQIEGTRSGVTTQEVSVPRLDYARSPNDQLGPITITAHNPVGTGPPASR